MRGGRPEMRLLASELLGLAERLGPSTGANLISMPASIRFRSPWAFASHVLNCNAAIETTTCAARNLSQLFLQAYSVCCGPSPPLHAMR
eukprot:8201282-Pyramimonas_sp.AAC.1